MFCICFSWQSKEEEKEKHFSRYLRRDEQAIDDYLQTVDDAAACFPIELTKEDFAFFFFLSFFFLWDCFIVHNPSSRHLFKVTQTNRAHKNGGREIERKINQPQREREKDRCAVGASLTAVVCSYPG